VRPSIVAIVKQMDPLDALIMEEMDKNPDPNWTPNGRDFMTARLKVSQEEILVSFDNLDRLGCIMFANPTTMEPPDARRFLAAKLNPIMAPPGRLLMSAVRN
jgi:hypothetical protein